MSKPANSAAIWVSTIAWCRSHPGEKAMVATPNGLYTVRFALAADKDPDGSEAANDASVQAIHLRLCKRVTELKSPIAALEEAAEEIADLLEVVNRLEALYGVEKGKEA